MFYHCNDLFNLNIGNFDFSKIQNIKDMFSKCNALLEISIYKEADYSILTKNFKEIKITEIKNNIKSK